MASTNKTTNYELSQYVGTDKPTYLGDYNSDMLKIDTAIHGVAENVGTESSRINIIENDIGTMANLQTSDKTSLVNAINEVNTNTNNNSTNIGSLASLTTTDKTTIVNAINEIKQEADSYAPRILWTNPNPTSDFVAQTITLTSTDSDMYEVIFTPSSGYNTFHFTSGRIEKGKNGEGCVINVHNNYIRGRIFSYVSDDQLAFETGYTTAITSPTIYAGDGHAIPQLVIGYKTGI